MTEAEAKEIVERYEALVEAVSQTCGGDFDDGAAALSVIDGELRLIKIAPARACDGTWTDRVTMPWPKGGREALGLDAFHFG